MVEELLAKYKHKSYQKNYYKPALPSVIVSIEEWNKIYKALRNDKDYEYLELTKGNSLKQGRNITYINYTIERTKKDAIIYIRNNKGIWTIKWTNKTAEKKDNDEITAGMAYKTFNKRCFEVGIHLDEYYTTRDEGIEIKQKIEKYLVKAAPKYIGKELNNVHHIDFHSSFMSGLVITHPEFYPVVAKLYEERKKQPYNKEILNYTIGWFQSKYIDFKLSHLAKDAINNNNDRLNKLTAELIKKGRTPVLWNTDGIWYLGEEYHGFGEGDGLGEWHNDYNAKRFRIKSDGCYEFEDETGYHPRMRGQSKLDEYEPREMWQWGDIFKQEAQEKKIVFNWEEGLMEVNDNE